jgi:hypothetical protein
MTATLLRSYLVVGAVDFESGFGGCCSLAREIAFEDYGAVEDVSA